MSSVAVTLTIVICFIHKCVGEFTVPSASFEAISPKGFTVSIPDVEGITLFGFHGSTTPIRSPQVGLWNRDVTKPTDGYWNYTNRDAELNSGDKIYFWTYVLYYGEGYRQHYGKWTVKVEKIEGGEKTQGGEKTEGGEKTDRGGVTELGVTTDRAQLKQETPVSEEPKPDTTPNTTPNSQIHEPEHLNPTTPIAKEPEQEILMPSIQNDAAPKEPTDPVMEEPKTDETIQFMPIMGKSEALVKDAFFKRPVENEAMQKAKSNTPLHRFQPMPIAGLKICEDTVSEVQNKGMICAGDLLFESNFDQLSTLDEKWTPEVVFPQEPDFPFVVYMNDTISLNNGHLAIKPELLEGKFGKGFIRKRLALKGCTGKIGTPECERIAAGAQILPPIVSGKLTTKNAFSFKYGKIEVRAKFPKGNWILPEMLLEPRDNKYGALDYASGVMKIASTKGNDVYARQLVGGVIMNDMLPFRSFALKSHNGQDLWNNDFHNYTLVWMPDRISMYVDGDNYGNIQESESFSQIGKRENIKAAQNWANGNKIAPFDQMFYISLGVQAGGVKVFLDSKMKPWVNKDSKGIVNFWKSKDSWAPTWSSAEFRVESVRVYAL